MDEKWMCVWRARPDLQKAFPDPKGVDEKTFVGWTELYGQGEYPTEDSFPVEAEPIPPSAPMTEPAASPQPVPEAPAEVPSEPPKEEAPIPLPERWTKLSKDELVVLATERNIDIGSGTLSKSRVMMELRRWERANFEE